MQLIALLAGLGFAASTAARFTVQGLVRPGLTLEFSPAAFLQDVQVAHLTLHAGPEKYPLNVPANGEWVETHKDLSVNIIDTPDYNAISQCHFKTAGKATLVPTITNGLQQIIVGPPQPIEAVMCQGTCVPTWSDCYHNNQPVGPCCSGYCAADKCRPWQ